MNKLSPRVWLTLVLVGLVGQFAWTIENMYFNVYLYNTISTDPGYISAMVGWSAAAATLTTLLMGALSDRVGKRKLFICGGYLLWGLSTAAFGLVTVENAAKLFPAAAATAAAAVMIVVLEQLVRLRAGRAHVKKGKQPHRKAEREHHAGDQNMLHAGSSCMAAK